METGQKDIQKWNDKSPYRTGRRIGVLGKTEVNLYQYLICTRRRRGLGISTMTANRTSYNAFQSAAAPELYTS